MPSSAAPPKPAPTSAPQDSDPRFVQQLLASVEHQTQRADEATKQRDEWKRQAEEWRTLYESEKQRATLLQGATEDRKEAQRQTAFAVTLLQEQHREDKQYIKELNEEVRRLQVSRFKWGIGGAFLGAGACYASSAPSIFR